MSHSINYIFYTDDDPDDHLIFSIALRDVRPSSVLRSFYDCKELLDYLNDDSSVLPDIIFLDQNMQGNSGNECLRQLKQMSRIKAIPVILYTTGAYPGQQADALSAGAYKYLLKQNYHSEIKACLSDILLECETLA